MANERYVRLVKDDPTDWLSTGSIRRTDPCPDLSESDWRGIEFKETAHFPRVNLTDARFDGVDLEGALFYRARLRGANFTNANLMGAHLDEADLTRADFTGANLERALLRGSILEDVILPNGDTLPEYMAPGGSMELLLTAGGKSLRDLDKSGAWRHCSTCFQGGPIHAAFGIEKKWGVIVLNQIPEQHRRAVALFLALCSAGQLDLCNAKL